MKLSCTKIALFGWPGAGKGTQAALLTQKTGLPHISTGDIFRELQNSTSKLAQEIKKILASGALVSDDLVTQITFERLKNRDCHHGFLLDGYPRTVVQAQAIQDSGFKLDCLILLDIKKEQIIKRLSGRRVCPTCNFVTRIDKFSQESCQKDQTKLIQRSDNNSEAILTCQKDRTKLIQRSDDSPEAIIKRLDIFEANFAPVRDFYQNLGRLNIIDAQGEEQEVFERITRSLGVSS